jgi:outer membrane protein
MKLRLIFALVTIFAAQSAMAFEAGQWFMRAGLANVAPGSSSDGIAIPALGVAPIPGTEAEADVETQLGLTINYMVNSRWGVELLAATPFSHEIKADLNGFSPGLEVDAGKVKQLPPTLSLNYYPMGGTGQKFQPYIGLGVNYTIFFSEDVDSDLEALTGTLAGAAGPVDMDLELDDSVGLAAQVGFDYFVNDNWYINAAIRYIDIETDAVFESALGDTITVDNVSIDPMVYQFTFGYSF